jgi:hypothetical protein
MLAAFETSIRKSSKDDADWRRKRGELYAEPKEIREARRRAAASGTQEQAPERMSVDDAEALLARFAASDALYGA